MFTLLVVTLQKTTEGDKHLTIISGLRAVNNKNFLEFLKYINRCDRRIMKQKKNLFFEERMGKNLSPLFLSWF